MKKAQKIAKYSVIFAVLAVIVGAGVLYHILVVREYEKKLSGKEHEVNHTKSQLEDHKASKGMTPEEVVKAVNKLREEAGVTTTITLDERLNASAYLKMRDMVANRYFSHGSPITGKSGASYVFDIVGNNSECRTASENLSIDRIATPKNTIDGWKESKPHYEAMIDPRVKSMGFATGRGYYNGDIVDYSVQHFCLSK